MHATACTHLAPACTPPRPGRVLTRTRVSFRVPTQEPLSLSFLPEPGRHPSLSDAAVECLSGIPGHLPRTQAAPPPSRAPHAVAPTSLKLYHVNFEFNLFLQELDVTGQPPSNPSHPGWESFLFSLIQAITTPTHLLLVLIDRFLEVPRKIFLLELAVRRYPRHPTVGSSTKASTASTTTVPVILAPWANSRSRNPILSTSFSAVRPRRSLSCAARRRRPVSGTNPSKEKRGVVLLAKEANYECFLSSSFGPTGRSNLEGGYVRWELYSSRCCLCAARGYIIWAR